VNDPSTLLVELLTESIDFKVFYRLVKEHEMELAPKRVADPHEHVAYVIDQALDLLARDPALIDLLKDGMMTALKDWYEEYEGI
jgi:hypothetical protein